MNLKLDKLPKTSIGIIAGIVISTVAITYSVVDKLIVEHYRLEIKRLEKLLDQKKTVENLNNIAANLRNVLEMQNKIIDSIKQKPKTIVKKNKTELNKFINEIDSLLQFADLIKSMDASNINTIQKYSLWRNQTIDLINAIDSELKTNFEIKFGTIVSEISLADYQHLQQNISDGILILKTIKNKLEVGL